MPIAFCVPRPLALYFMLILSKTQDLSGLAPLDGLVIWSTVGRISKSCFVYLCRFDERLIDGRPLDILLFGSDNGLDFLP